MTKLVISISRNLRLLPTDIQKNFSVALLISLKVPFDPAKKCYFGIMDNILKIR